MSEFISFFQDGGPFMIPIAIILLFATVLAIERWFKVFYLYSVNSDRFIAEIQNLVLNKNYDQAITICNGKPSALLPQVVKAALKEAGHSIDRVSNGIEEATLEAIPKLQKRQSLLPMLANTATLLGLLGTIVGLIGAFAAVAHAEPSQKAELLTQSISIAMNTTAFGLMVAIPTNLIATFIQERVSKIIGDIDQYATRIAHLIVVRKDQ